MPTTSIVSVTQEWDATKAGQFIAQDISNKIGDSPDLVLLFATIQYMKDNGFQKILNEIHKKIPKDKVVGGTIAGFNAPQGCFTHGVAALTIKSDEMDFAIATAENIKRNPEKAAEECGLKIKNALENSKKNNKFLLTLASGTTTPRIPGITENTRVIRSKILSKILIIGVKLSLLIMQKGPGREEGIIEKLAEIMPEYKMIGGSFIDDIKGFNNFQFVNGTVCTNNLITIGISTNTNISVNSGFGLERRSEDFQITKKSVFDLVIEKINNKDAFNEILRILKWPAYFLDEASKLPIRTLYAPIGYTINGKNYTSMIAFIYGTGIVISPKVRSETAHIMSTSGKKLIEIVDTNLADTSGKDILFGLSTSCIVRLQTLGASNYKIHEKYLKHFGTKPFLQIDVVGEDVYTKELGAKRIADSHNTAIFYN
jgi:hypothetical protein